MRWSLTLKGTNKDGSKHYDTLYYLTRQEMRVAQRFYKTMCDPPLDSVVYKDHGI